VAEVLNVIGEVKDQDVVVFDDMVDTAGTLTLGVEALKREGAKRIFAACTHAVLSGPAVARIEKSGLEKVFVTDTIPLKESARNHDKLQVLSVAELFGEAIKRINEGSSVSSLFT
jgi:ribose-phosphate pyrophosphokinase